ncbi:DsbA family protein [Aeromicrobium sp. CTD01-1L150]|uniref:DsbA family protein n=1 Tax=Aeromicrobium sp. CTD01-1L150 TaxID=3341830 RepID=UPI0035BFDF58
MTNDRKKRAERAELMRKEREKADKRQRNIITIVIVAVVVALIAAFAWGFYVLSEDNAKSTELVAPQGATDDYGVLYTPQDAGAEDTEGDPVVVELYEDFLCPGCAAFEQANGQFLNQAVAEGEISILYRPYAFLTGQSTNRYSQRAANAAACVLDDSGVTAFKQMHDILFANQPSEGGAGPEDDELADFAEQAGAGDIEQCLRTEKFTPWVEKALERGQEEDVSGTPTVRIDGEDVSGADEGTIPGPAELQGAIEAAQAG